MANKSFFLCFLATLSLLIGQTAFAFNAPLVYYEQPETCNAPAPTNFRITERSANFIVLAWDPAWSGATHTLAILESDGQGGWIGVDTLHQVPGDTYTADGLTPGQTYRFVIATNCEDGSPSGIKAFIDGSSLIVDLTTFGRAPLSPQQSIPCENIPLNTPWKGFRVAHIGGSPLLRNEFEFAPEGFPENGSNNITQVQFRRVGLGKPIVAAKSTGEIPDCFEPVVEKVSSSFKIVQLGVGGTENEVIGFVNFSLTPSSFNICPDYSNIDFPWKSEYELSGLIAGRVGGVEYCGGWLDNPNNDAQISIQNINQEQIKIDAREIRGDRQAGNIWIFNTSGQALTRGKIELSAPDFETYFDISQLNPGVFFVLVEVDGRRETHKVVVIR